MRRLTKYMPVAFLSFIVGVFAVVLLSKGVGPAPAPPGMIGCNGPETGYVPSSLNPNERYEVVPATATEPAHWDKYCSGVRIPFEARCPYPADQIGSTPKPK